MILNRIKNCDLSEEDKFNLNLILDSGDIDFVQNYLKEIEMKTRVVNLVTADVCRVFDQTKSVKETAVKLGCCDNTITNHLKKAGYYFDLHSQKWTKPMNMNMNMNMLRKNRQAEVVTWLLNGEYTQNTITTDIVANKFGCTCDQASGYLTGISEKGILGMKRIGRKLYQFNPVMPSGTKQNEVAVEPAAVTVEPAAVKHSVPCVKPKADIVENIEAIQNLAERLGGLEELVRMARLLIDFKSK